MLRVSPVFIAAVLLVWPTSALRLPKVGRFLRRSDASTQAPIAGAPAVPIASDEGAVAEAATPAGRAKLEQVRKVLSDETFVTSVASSLPSFGRDRSATAEEREAIRAARAKLVDDPWVAARSDAELLPFARSCSESELADRLAETSAWRTRVLPASDDLSWEFGNFFERNADKFLENPELGERPFLEWVKARDEDAEGAPPLALEGATVLLLRPGRHKVGAIDPDTWLRLIAWHGERATLAWAGEQAAAAGQPPAAGDDLAPPGRGAITIVVDRTGSGLRNQDPALLKELLPPLTRHFPYALHCAYIAPINVVFWAIWSVVKLVLPSRVTARFTLLRGDDWRETLAEKLGPSVAERLPI